MLFFFTIVLVVPKTSKAVDFQEVLTSENSIIVKIQEGVEYFFTFKVEDKILVLEKQAEKRLVMAQSYADKGNNDRLRDLLQNYLQIKEKQDSLLGKIDGGEVLGAVEERTIEQQMTMEEIKTKIDENGKRNVIQVQEQVVNQVAQRVVEVNGAEGRTEFFNKVEHVWAPGTGPGGESGVVYEGGGKLIFAPGTSAGGPSGQDIKTVEIKTGGAVNEPVPVPDGQNYAPGTTSGGGNTSPTTNTIDPGSIDPDTSSDGDTWLAP